MFGKILNATVTGLSAIPFAFAAYHVCKNLFAEEKPAVEENEEQESVEEQEHVQPEAEQAQGDAPQKEEVQAPVKLTGNKVSIVQSNVQEELNNVADDE